MILNQIVKAVAVTAIFFGSSVLLPAAEAAAAPAGTSTAAHSAVAANVGAPATDDMIWD